MTTDSVPQISLKRCKKCGEEYPATTEYFPHTEGRLSSPCRKCNRERIRQYRRENPEKAKAAARRHREKHPERVAALKHRYYESNKASIAEKERKYRAANKERIAAQKALYRERTRERAKERSREWREANPEQHRETLRRYYQEHKDELNRYGKTYYEANRQRYRETSKAWRNKNKDRIVAYQKENRTRLSVIAARREARVKGLPDNYSLADWLYALDYFHHCCAICGRQLRDLFGTHTVAQDHWIPLDSENCPGTIPSNIIPLCHGVGGCNNKKHTRDPIEFVNAEFSKRDAERILKRIQIYFDSLD